APELLHDIRWCTSKLNSPSSGFFVKSHLVSDAWGVWTVAQTACPHRHGDLWKVTNALGQVTESVSYDRDGCVRARRTAKTKQRGRSNYAFEFPADSATVRGLPRGRTWTGRLSTFATMA
ncbi:MAG: hypothetical protein LC131_01540, partial [Anaerolineae bacterium]|nr:hypothetical protein [Anaerolineae bacterium]